MRAARSPSDGALTVSAMPLSPSLSRGDGSARPGPAERRKEARDGPREASPDSVLNDSFERSDDPEPRLEAAGASADAEPDEEALTDEEDEASGTDADDDADDDADASRAGDSSARSPPTSPSPSSSSPHPAALAPAIRPHAFLPGAFTLDVPGLRLGGPCHRTCCDPTAQSEWLRKHAPRAMLLPPLFPGTESVVVFGACEAASEAAGLRRCPLEQTPRVRFGGVRNNAVKAAFKTAGFRALKSGSIDAEGSFPFNAAWNGALKREDLKRLNRLQRVNHFPGTWELGRKDRLGRNAGRARRRNAEVFDIMPRSFVLPHDADEWRIECDRFPDGMYIIKPPASSRGRGIRMMTRPSDIKPEKDYVIQRYVGDPHLIDGYKYDLRVYVAVTCVDPLRVYVYREGLVRFATERYTDAGEDLKRRCVHLTNYSVNVKTEAFAMGQGAEEDDVGHKWSLSALRRHFEEKLGIGFGETWARIKDVVVKTMMCVDDRMNVSAKMHVPDRRNCYELFGFDVMLDARLKPWLIEVNTGPSLSAPSALDMHIKHRMAANLFNLVGFAPYDRAAMKKTLEERRRARLVGVPRADAIASTKTNAAPPARAFPKTRDAKTLRAIDFDDYALEDLPEVIRDAEAELARAGEFERCFPAPDPEDNAYYLRHFETPRFDNALLCAWEAHKRDVLRRRKKRGGADDPNPNPNPNPKPPGSRPGSRAGATRPPSRAAAGGPGPRPRSRLSRGGSAAAGASAEAADVDALASSLATRAGLADGHAAAGARDSPGGTTRRTFLCGLAAAAPGTRGGGEAAATRRAAPRAGIGARHPPAARGLATPPSLAKVGVRGTAVRGVPASVLERARRPGEGEGTRGE